LNFKKIPIESNFWISHVDNHEEIKKKILDAIATMGRHNIIEDGQSIFNTDWHLSNKYQRPYWDIALPLINKHNENLENCFLSNGKIQIKNYWFQQYELNNYHNWHIHDLMFSNIYYVSLPQNSATTFSLDKKEFVVEVQEGDIVTFPSVFEHCSKPNKTEEVKTIISYNSVLFLY
jgi:hypothetical protein